MEKKGEETSFYLHVLNKRIYDGDQAMRGMLEWWNERCSLRKYLICISNQGQWGMYKSQKPIKEISDVLVGQIL